MPAVPATRRRRQSKTTVGNTGNTGNSPSGFAMRYPPSGRCVHAVAAKLGRKDFALSDGWRSLADELNAQLALQHLAGGVARQRRDEHHRLRDLELGEPAQAVLDHVAFLQLL